MDHSHNTHNISYTSLSDHSYKFDKDGNIIVDNIEDLIYDKGINGIYHDKKQKPKEKFLINFKIVEENSNNSKINSIKNKFKLVDNGKKEIIKDENKENFEDKKNLEKKKKMNVI